MKPQNIGAIAALTTAACSTFIIFKQLHWMHLVITATIIATIIVDRKTQGTKP